MKKSTLFYALAMVACLTMIVGGLMPSCTQVQSAQTAAALTEQLTTANVQLQTARQQVVEVQAQVDAAKAAGQPVSPDLAKFMKDATDKLTKATAVLNDVLAKAQAYKEAVDAAATQPNPNAAATGATIRAGTAAAAPFIPAPWGPVVALVGSLVGTAVAGYAVQKTKTDAANQRTDVATDTLNRAIQGVQQGLLSGDLIASPKAAEVVDSAFANDNHPASTTLYNVLKANATPTTP